MAFPKEPRKVICVTIDEDGNNVFLKTDATDCFLEQGEVITRRASHVLPVAFWKRQAFRLLRTLVPDTSRLAAWSRTWRGPWLVDTAPTAGVILQGRWANRQDAIDAEVEFLNDYFLRRPI